MKRHEAALYRMFVFMGSFALYLLVALLVLSAMHFASLFFGVEYVATDLYDLWFLLLFLFASLIMMDIFFGWGALPEVDRNKYRVNRLLFFCYRFFEKLWVFCFLVLVVFSVIHFSVDFSFSQLILMDLYHLWMFGVLFSVIPALFRGVTESYAIASGGDNDKKNMPSRGKKSKKIKYFSAYSLVGVGLLSIVHVFIDILLGEQIVIEPGELRLLWLGLVVFSFLVAVFFGGKTSRKEVSGGRNDVVRKGLNGREKNDVVSTRKKPPRKHSSAEGLKLAEQRANEKKAAVALQRAAHKLAARKQSEVQTGAARKQSEVQTGAARKQSEVQTGAARKQSEVQTGSARKQSEVQQQAARKEGQKSVGKGKQ